MSTLKTNTIQHLTSGFNNVVAHTDGAGTVNAVHARAWVNFNGSGVVAIRSQFNVSSITDNGTGDYTVNFSNALSDANFSAVGSCAQSSTDPWRYVGLYNSFSTSSFRLVASYPGSPTSGQDVELVCATIHR